MPEPENKGEQSSIQQFMSAGRIEKPVVPTQNSTLPIRSSVMPEPIPGTAYGTAQDKWEKQKRLGNIPESVIAVADVVNLNNDDEEINRRKERARQEYERVERNPVEGKYDSIVDLIVEAKSEEDRKFWLYFALERIISYNDDWSARINREDLAKRVAMFSPERAELLEEKWDIRSDKAQKYESIHRALIIIQDLDLVFDQWTGFYKKISPTGKIFQAAFGQEPEYMPPERLARIYGELPGFKEGDKEWKSMSEQVDIALRAYIYLALQSDPRWKNDFEWYRKGDGFKKLFANESTELDFLRRLKLKTLPNEMNDLAHLRGKKLEELKNSDLKHLDAVKAFNKFADPGTGGTVKAMNEAIIELLSQGKYKDTKSMQMQSRIATDLADKTMRYMGIAAMYGTRGTEFEVEYVENGEKIVEKITSAELAYLPSDFKILKASKVAAEDYPWSDALTDLMRPKDNTTYNVQNSYFPGPTAWVNFGPDGVMVDFLRMLPVTDENYPESKFEYRSAFELFVDGKSIGDIMKDENHVGDWGYRAYLIRILFSLREDSGAYLALNGELVRGKNKDNIFDEKFLEDVEKSIHIVCRNWIVTKGRFEEWFDKHEDEILTKVHDPDFINKLKKRYSRKQIDATDEIIRNEAADSVLSTYVTREKNKWKAIVWLNSMQYLDPVRMKAAVLAAKRVGYLDPKVLDLTKDINFESNPDKIKEQIKYFINQARFSAS